MTESKDGINFTNFVRGFVIWDASTAFHYARCHQQVKEVHLHVAEQIAKIAFLDYGSVPESQCTIDLKKTTWGDCV
jgi:hypothetical protein